MLQIAWVLGMDFICVRADLYSVDDKIYFGEMTFTSDAGIGKWIKEEQIGRIVDFVELGGDQMMPQ